MHMKYEAQLRHKQSEIEKAASECTAHLGSEVSEMIKEAVRETVASEERGCRHKSIRYFAEDREGVLQSGFFAPRTHSLIPVYSCPAESAAFGRIAEAVTLLLREEGIRAARQDGTDGSECRVRALLLRDGDESEFLVMLILTAAPSEKLLAGLRALAEREHITSFHTGINDKAGNSLFTSDTRCISGREYIRRTVSGKLFEIGPSTFMQVNHEICEKLYEAAVSYCTAGREKGSGTALDLCCGIGTMTLSLSDTFAHTTGVETVEASVAAARKNAELNGKGGREISFIAGDVKKVLPSLIKSCAAEGIDAVISDPARAGIGRECAAKLAKIKGPCRAALIYCSLTALRRELPEFIKGGFKTEYIGGFDMFPNTGHVETLVLLQK